MKLNIKAKQNLTVVCGFGLSIRVKLIGKFILQNTKVKQTLKSILQNTKVKQG
jgi:hypothetical protein